MSFLTQAIDTVVGTYGKIKQKAKFTDVLGYVVGSLPTILMDFAQAKTSNVKERIDVFWMEFDNRTGLEGAQIIRDMPPDAEERALDGLKVLGRELCYWAAGVYGPAPDAEALKQVGALLTNSFPAFIAGANGSAENGDGSPTGFGFDKPAKVDTAPPKTVAIADDELPPGSLFLSQLNVLETHHESPGTVQVKEQISIIRAAVIGLLKVELDRRG